MQRRDRGSAQRRRPVSLISGPRGVAADCHSGRVRQSSPLPRDSAYFGDQILPMEDPECCSIPAGRAPEGSCRMGMRHGIAAAAIDHSPRHLAVADAAGVLVRLPFTGVSPLRGNCSTGTSRVVPWTRRFAPSHQAVPAGSTPQESRSSASTRSST